ncbi:hypothetical protein AGDE_13608 [Angomonas deanei]|uniref:Cyclic nucleotide-binding domain containing protein, putative n=1 Tax=Angomonas deanei TaxID=59799 RepID=A0A7G2C638_9TRYP|nr:hypothetical protein AGDE_13608 [Angomonas deanei]CAD2215240.1 Cyclic nucleotide-binding domain containing protein, putative [Angomonas deanei]|eukprot:EPY22023.1 hypothetical protein AGDE_13608 [Angomonas deanei]
MSSSGHQSQQSQHTPPSPHSFQGKNPLQSGSDEPNVVPLADVLPAELSGCLKQEEVCSIAKAPSPPPREPSLVGASSSALIHEGRTRLEALLPQIPPSKYASLIVFMEGLVSTQDLLSEAGSAAGPAEALSPGATAADTNAAHLAASPSGSVISASATAAQINEQFSRALSSSTVPHLPESQASESLRAIVRDALSQSVMRSLPQDHGEPSEHNKSPVNRSPNIANMDYPSSPLPVLHAEESSPSVAPPRDDTRTPTGREVTVQYESPTLKEDTTTTVELFSPSPAQTETVADLVQVDSNASVPFPPDKSTTSTIEQSTTTQHAEAASTTSVPTISVSGNIKDLKTIKVGPAAGESRAKKETREGDMPDEVRMDSTIRMAVEQLLAGGEVGVTETAPSSSVNHNNTQEKKSSRLATPENGSIVHSSAVHLAPEGEPQPQPNGEENSTPLPIAETTDGKANPHATSNMVEAMSQFFNAEESRPEEVNTVREALMNYEPFEALDLTQLETLLRTMKRQEYQEGEVLVREGDPSLNKLMFIVSGKLSSARKGKHTKMLNQGSFYGVMEVSYNFDKSRQTLTVKEPGTVIYCLTKTDYQKLILYEKDARRFLFLQYVNKVPFLRQLSPAGKFRLADGLRVSRVREGSYLTRIGANVEWFYIIMSGDVAMTAKKINDGSGSANLTNSGKENEATAPSRTPITRSP